MLKVSVVIAALLLGSYVLGDTFVVNDASFTVEVNKPSSGNLLQKISNGRLFNKHASDETDKQSRAIISYTLGGRQSGDALVVYTLQTNSWMYPTNVALTITYPKSGTGGIVTYVEILVNQSNNSGRAYVTRGGIGQREIEIVVEADETYWFNYEVNIYAQ